MRSKRTTKQNVEKRKSQENMKSIEEEGKDTNIEVNECIENSFDSLDMNSDQLQSTHEAQENVGRDHQKQSKRKANMCDYETSEGKVPKTAKNNLTPESLPSVITATPQTRLQPSSTYNDDFSFLRRLSSHSTSTTKKDYFAALPDEVLLMMFKELPKISLISCARVCKRWKRIAYDNDLWPKMDLSLRKLVPGSMAHVLMRGPQIVRMSQTEVNTPIFKGMEESMENFISKMEYLDLSMATITSPDLELLLRTCRFLRKLSLENCEINEKICNDIAQNDRLTVLNMSQCTGLDEAGIKVILINCKKLVELNVAWTSLNSAAVKTMCQYVPRDILRINLSGCLKEINDTHVNALAMRCHKLKELDLSDATGISDNTVKAIYNDLKDLEVLSLSRCYHILPSSYTKLFMLPKITHLNIFGLFHETQIDSLRKTSDIKVNMMKFSSVARPTVGVRRTSIWGISLRDKDLNA